MIGTIGRRVSNAKCTNPFLNGSKRPFCDLVPSGNMIKDKLLSTTARATFFMDSIAAVGLDRLIRRWFAKT
nr:hypothetical protein Iba_chr03dCG5460 [Ipomoea batatas]